ncbi:hypothetical protein [Arthrobacter sp. NPDC090010]|uniref:hypothetical protein n=1 Tax=Arthrobacter sp. NPDC090010 TaxID=3363942 RepID=UPI0037F7B136
MVTASEFSTIFQKENIMGSYNPPDLIRIESKEFLRTIQILRTSGLSICGMEGFHRLGESIVPDLDMILDLSGEGARSIRAQAATLDVAEKVFSQWENCEFVELVVCF